MKFNNGVTEVTLDGVSAYSYEPFRENLQLVKAHGIKKLNLTMLNPGGSIYHMWGIYDMLKAAVDSGLVLHTNAHGMIASAAVPIFLLGEVRTMQEHAYIMIHSHNAKQSDYKAKSFNRMTANWTREYIAILLERTTMSRTEINLYLGNDRNPSKDQFWMGYTEAESRGFLTL
jgi:ATP-dependent protease ClpP protease subunit